MTKPASKIALTPFAIVDDHRAVADIMGYALQTRLPVQCVARFNSVSEAKAKLPESNPSVVIADWRLGEEAGGELIRAMRPRMPSTRWLLFTAWPTPSVLREALPAGIQGCVSKSADYEELARALKEVIDGGSYFCAESLKALGQGIEGNTLAATLSDADRAILRYIADGLEPKEISVKVGLTTKTVHNYLVIIRQKLNLGSMVSLAKFAVDQGIAPTR
jgi:DNA-binding NarL/FixJ family response regulator